ncbi:MAG: leucine-rich repeat protein, partial [Thermoguttaceae bacterium]|nr:leucine-rich repeat protein [Thermoguttaceae bacterium]
MNEDEIDANGVSLDGKTFVDCPRGREGEFAVPNGVVKIDAFAFSHQPSLTLIDIPASVTEIGEGAFVACPSLERFTVDANNPRYCAIDGVLFTKDRQTLIKYPA